MPGEGGFPRLAPSLIRRPKIESWLVRHANLPVRFLAAPAGSGKTTAVVAYARGNERAIYLHLQPGEGPSSLRARLGRALGLSASPRSYREMLDALGSRGSAEIALDDAGLAAEETIDEVGRLVLDAPAGIGWIVCARSRNVLDASGMLARGSVALCDAEMLAFDAHDTIELAELLGVQYVPAAVERLLQESDGWSVAVCAAIRHAADTGAHLSGALEAWFRRQGRFFAEFIREEMGYASERERAAFRRLLAGSAEDLSELEADGLFVRYTDEGYRPYRVVARLCRAEPRLTVGDALPAQLLSVRMFGRFEAEIGGRSIHWLRRRDQDIFKYLLLEPNGCASRAQLIETFWPQADPHLASASLRTACANLRKAIAAAVGNDSVEQYLSTRGVISLNLANVVLDVRRLRAHISDGDAEYERGRHEEAIAHYRAADALYRGPLLPEDARAPWFVARVSLYEELYVRALERQAECWLAKGEPSLARQCAFGILKFQSASLEGRRLLQRTLSGVDAGATAGQKRGQSVPQRPASTTRIALDPGA